jgi:RNA polymerase sigma factor (sigma-70 family)
VGSNDIYLSHRDLIERVLSHVCRRHRLASADAEDFVSSARLHLIDSDCEVIRSFRGRSSLETYLVTVITHFFQDWRNARWGKWRPSAEARRRGPVAVHLERLTVRDGLTLDEAFETLRTNFALTISRAEIEDLAARFPSRAKRRLITDDALESHADVGAGPDAEVRRQEAEEDADRSSSAMAAALARLPAQDRLLLRLSFEDGISIADIARILRLDSKALYRRRDRLLGELRGTLESHGVTAETAREILEQGGFDLAPDRRRHSEFWGDVRPTEDGGHPPVTNERVE